MKGRERFPAQEVPDATSLVKPAARLLQRPGFLIAGSAFFVYLLLPTKDYYWDGVSFALNIEMPGRLTALLHPNHLLYNLLGFAAWRAVLVAGAAVRALPVLQAMDALFAAAGVFLVWRILTAMTGSVSRSTGWTLLFAFSAAWWRFSTDADAYVVSIFFLLLCFYLLTHFPDARPVAAGLAHGTAMVFHQLAILFMPAALIAIFLSAGRKPAGAGRAGMWARAVEYLTTAAGVTAAVYGTAFRILEPSGGVRDFLNWITAHAEDASFTFNVPGNLRLSGRGTMRLFLGGRVTWASFDLLTAAGVAVAVAALLLLGRQLLFPRGERHDIFRESMMPRIRGWLRANRIAIAWLAPYGAFLCCWQPQNTFYRLFYLPPLIFLLATAPSWRLRQPRTAALLATFLLAWNFTFLIRPHAAPAGNEVLTFALQHKDDFSEGAEIVYTNFHSDLWVIRYFNPRSSWTSMPFPTAGEVESCRQEAAHTRRRLWLEGRTFDALAAAPEGLDWLRRNVDPSGSLLLSSPSHTIRFYRVIPGLPSPGM